MVFILVPEDGRSDGLAEARAAQKACRVAHMLGFLPFSPLLHYATYLSPGELAMEKRKLHWQWLRRCDRIWLQFVSMDEDRIDNVAYDILDQNGRLGPRFNNCQGRRPVYQLHPTGSNKIGYVPVAMSRQEVKELLDINVTVGLTKGCM